MTTGYATAPRLSHIGLLSSFDGRSIIGQGGKRGSRVNIIRWRPTEAQTASAQRDTTYTAPYGRLCCASRGERQREEKLSCLFERGRIRRRRRRRRWQWANVCWWTPMAAVNTLPRRAQPRIALSFFCPPLFPTTLFPSRPCLRRI